MIEPEKEEQQMIQQQISIMQEAQLTLVSDPWNYEWEFKIYDQGDGFKLAAKITGSKEECEICEIASEVNDMMAKREVSEDEQEN